MSTLARRPVLLAAAAVAALLLAGCSSGSESAESSAEAPNASTVQTLPTRAPAQTQGAEPGEGAEQGEGAEGGEEDGDEAEGEDGEGAMVAPSGAGTTASYTLADVSGHATPQDCWSAIDGGVFDLTSWIPQHPGGSEVVAAMCGVDGSASYDSVHAGQGEPAQVLAQLQVGVLAG